MRKKYVIIGILAIVAFYKVNPFGRNSSQEKIEKRSGFVPVALNKIIEGLPEKKKVDQALSRKVTLKLAPEASIVSFFKTKSESFFEIKTKIDRAQKLKEFWDQNANDENLIVEAKEILTNLDSTISSYKEKQAEARIFSISLLEERARRGSLEPLEQALGDMIVEQQQSPDHFSEHGRMQDLSDLITAWIDASGRKAFVQNPAIFFERFYSDRRPSRAEVLLIMKAAHNSVPLSFNDQNFLKRFYKFLGAKS